MKSIKLRSHVGENGVLQLEVPVGLKNADLEVMVIFQPVPEQSQSPAELGYSKEFIEEVLGGWVGEPLERGNQNDDEQREIFN